MPDVVGIRFKSCGKIYNFEVNGTEKEIKKGDLVIVESELGLSIGRVITEIHTVEATDKELKKVLRKMTEEDIRQKKENESYEKEAKEYCLERIMARGLPMKLICTEATLDKKRIIFYFIADGRIDFREIVKDLAAKFKTRIEMRQIGVRDEAKIVGGFGMCGRELCCKTFLTSFEPISIKMAKQQDLVLNMNKLSGVCGRLMCCLGYEIPGETPADTGAETGDNGTDAIEENNAPQDVIGDAPQPATETKINADIKQTAAASFIPQKAERHSPENQQTTATPSDNAEKKHHHRHRRHKRRWRKFHKPGNPENK